MGCGASTPENVQHGDVLPSTTCDAVVPVIITTTDDNSHTHDMPAVTKRVSLLSREKAASLAKNRQDPPTSVDSIPLLPPDASPHHLRGIESSSDIPIVTELEDISEMDGGYSPRMKQMSQSSSTHQASFCLEDQNGVATPLIKGGGTTTLPRKRSSIRTSNLFLNTAKPDDLDIASETRTPRNVNPNVLSPRPNSLGISTPILLMTFNDTFEKDDDASDAVTEFVSLLPPPGHPHHQQQPTHVARSFDRFSSVSSSFGQKICHYCRSDLVPRAKFCHECGKRAPVANTPKQLLHDSNSNSMSSHTLANDSGTDITQAHTVYHRQVKIARSDRAILGRGGKGCIYKAMDVATGKPLAVKEMELDFSDLVEVNNIRTELRHLSSLKHPHVVEYLGCSVEEGRVSILMERLECGSLADLLKQFRSGIPEDAVRTLTAQLLQAVAYCHGVGTTHRDIKPANILQSASGSVKLSDFGSAIVRSAANDDLGHENVHVAGTPSYMPPEVLDIVGKRREPFEYGTAHDVWSIGCTVHELLTGKAPWSELQLEPIQLLFRMKDLDFTIDESLSDDAKNFVSACLRRDRATRPSAEQLLQHSFVC